MRNVLCPACCWTSASTPCMPQVSPKEQKTINNLWVAIVFHGVAARYPERDIEKLLWSAVDQRHSDCFHLKPERPRDCRCLCHRCLLMIVDVCRLQFGFCLVSDVHADRKSVV